MPGWRCCTSRAPSGSGPSWRSTLRRSCCGKCCATTSGTGSGGIRSLPRCSTAQHVATCFSMLQHTATCCNAARRSAGRHVATQLNALLRTRTYTRARTHKHTHAHTHSHSHSHSHSLSHSLTHSHISQGRSRQMRNTCTIHHAACRCILAGTRQYLRTCCRWTGSSRTSRSSSAPALRFDDSILERQRDTIIH